MSSTRYLAIAALFGVPAGFLLLVYALFFNDGDGVSLFILLPILILTPLTLSTTVMGLVKAAKEQRHRDE